MQIADVQIHVIGESNMKKTKWEYWLNKFGGCTHALSCGLLDNASCRLAKTWYTLTSAAATIIGHVSKMFLKDSALEGCAAEKNGVNPRSEIETAKATTFPSSPFFSFYSVGPDMLTHHYPVAIEVYKEITDDEGLIGPKKYKDYPGAIDAMKDNDNSWFLEEEHEKVRLLLEKDLLALAKKHESVGAYSLLASISQCQKDQVRYRQKGIELGCPKCMVGEAMTLYASGRTQDGFALLKRGADQGEKIGCLMVAISYQHGTISEIDINKACEYYFKALGGEDDFYIYLNLGCILIESGYYHTAVHYFKKMYDASKKDADYLKEYRNEEKMVQNLDTSLKLIRIPYAERAKHVKIQAHSRRLTSIFCKSHIAPEPYVPEHIPYSIKGFEPSAELFDIAPEDLRERAAFESLPSTRPVNKTVDYLFLTIPIKINNHIIHGTQQEIIFLEKCCHAALNSYIEANLIPLRSMFKSMGYIFTYLPSHMDGIEDMTDRIGSFYNDYGTPMWEPGWDSDQISPDLKAQEYWQTIVPSEKLPDDCAGFLIYTPNLKNLKDHTNYDYILFPYRPGTDWARAFREFFTPLRGRTIVHIHNNGNPVALLPAGSCLHISSSYDFTLRDNCDKTIAEVKMPTLSKVVYLVLLNHPEGIVIKCMIDYKNELWEYYKAIAGNKAKIENIDTLCDSTNNSINEKLSRIKFAFTTAMKGKYAEDIHNFIPAGKRGESISVSIERDRIKYDKE